MFHGMPLKTFPWVFPAPWTLSPGKSNCPAPWYVVPADHKWFTHLVIARAIVEATTSAAAKGYLERVLKLCGR